MTQAIAETRAIVDCPHLHAAIETQGSIIFTGGDVLDTLTDHLFCADCGAELTETEPDNDLPY